MSLCPAVRIVAEEEIEASLERETHIPPNWEGFRTRFPGAERLIRVSLPAFAPDQNTAVVYLESTCGGLCGTGFYIELTKAGTGWKISRRAAAWIS